MLHIDRVNAEMDLRPTGSSDQASTAPAVARADEQSRERIRALVREALRDELRELERQGVI
jgi:hypothetical protein